MLTDGDRIRALLGTYGRLVDAGDFEGLGRLMAGAVLRTLDGTAVATGAEQVAALYAGIVRLQPDGTPGTQHLVVGTALDDEVPGWPDGTVRATSSYVVLQAVAGLALQPVVTGTYVDTFGQDAAGTWSFLERRFGISLSGDLEHHLTHPGVTA